MCARLKFPKFSRLSPLSCFTFLVRHPFSLKRGRIQIFATEADSWGQYTLRRLALCGGICWALSGCKMDEPDSARWLASQLAYPGSEIYFKSKHNCTAAVYFAAGSETKFKVQVTDNVDIALGYIEAVHSVALDNDDVSPNDFTSYASTQRAPGAMRTIAAGTAAIRCMPEEIQAHYMAALLRAETVTIVDLENSALVLLDRVAAKLFLVRGGL